MDLKDYKHENDLYKQLADLKEAREFIKNAIHHNFYNRTVVDNLYVKFHDVNKKILKIKYQIKKERLKNEKESRKEI